MNAYCSGRYVHACLRVHTCVSGCLPAYVCADCVWALLSGYVFLCVGTQVLVLGKLQSIGGTPMKMWGKNVTDLCVVCPLGATIAAPPSS